MTVDGPAPTPGSAAGPSTGPGPGPGPGLGRELVLRTGARVLLLDAAGRVLLMRGRDPAEVPPRRYWFTLGGGLEPGESPREGAVRELYEETGLLVGVDEVRGPIWHEDVEFGFDRWWVRQAQDFFVVHVHAWEAAPAALEPLEAATVDTWAWWSVPELRAQAAGRPHPGPGEPGEIVYPAVLPDLVEEAVRDGGRRPT